MNNIRIFKTPEVLAEEFAGELAGYIREAEAGGRTVSIAISGGSTPKLLFKELAEKYFNSVSWNCIDFYWVDERCVRPDDSESNYGMTRKILFDRIDIPLSNVHRMKGEENPEKEADRYSGLLASNLRRRDGFPVFDLVLLGMGDDGHTASIFPGNLTPLNSDRICEVAVNPYSGQKRITITGKVINNADAVIFLVTGKNKADIAGDILNRNVRSVNYPASYIAPVHGSLQWLFDEEAARFVQQ
jgi:6-phosphogluconolactonase